MPSNHKSKYNRRKIVWKKTDGICAHCGHKIYGDHQSIDHFIPKSLGGGYDIKNLVPLCKKCNKERGNKKIDPNEFYSYAPKHVIKDCLTYERIWKCNNKSLNGYIHTNFTH